MAVTYLWSARAASAALKTRLSSRPRLSRSGLANPTHPFHRTSTPLPLSEAATVRTHSREGVPLVQGTLGSRLYPICRRFNSLRITLHLTSHQPTYTLA